MMAQKSDRETSLRAEYDVFFSDLWKEFHISQCGCDVLDS